MNASASTLERLVRQPCQPTMKTERETPLRMPVMAPIEQPSDGSRPTRWLLALALVMVVVLPFLPG